MNHYTIRKSRNLDQERKLRIVQSWASLVAQLVTNPPEVQSLGWEDPLEKGTCTHSIILAWRISWTVKSLGWQRAGHNLATFTFSLWLDIQGQLEI